MVKEDKRVAPYIPFKTFLTALDVLSQGLPGQLDTSVWPSFSGAVRTQVYSAFKFLNLIDDEGHVQPDLQRLLGEDRKAVLREVLEHSYPRIVELGRGNASPAQLSEAMREHNVSGETLEKAERFFLQAAEHTQLPVSPLWKKTRRGRASERRRPKPAKRRKASGDGVSQEKPTDTESQAKDLMTVHLKSGGTVVLGVTASITRMSVEDRQFVFDIIDKMKGYTNGSGPDESKEVEIDG